MIFLTFFFLPGAALFWLICDIYFILSPTFYLTLSSSFGGGRAEGELVYCIVYNLIFVVPPGVAVGASGWGGFLTTGLYVPATVWLGCVVAWVVRGFSARAVRAKGDG